MALTRVAVFAGSHWIVGFLHTDGRRLNEVANDRASEFFSLVDARVHHGPDLRTPMTTLPRMVVPKAAVTLIASLSDRHEAPEKRRTYLQKKLVFPVFVTVNGSDVTGHMHLTSRIDPVALLVRMAAEGAAFFAVADAEVTQLPMLGGSELAPVVLVARTAITGCYLADTPI